MGNLVTTAVITDIANSAAAKQSYCERAASRSSSFISPSPSALRLVAGRLTVHENSRHLEVDRRGPAPVEVCEQWLLASPPFLLAPGSRSRSFLRLWSQLYTPTDCFGARELVWLSGGPCMPFSQLGLTVLRLKKQAARSGEVAFS